MAQSKRKRQTKHRGTQAGSVESRGRTSRPRSRAEARQQALQRKQGNRVTRANLAPTWRGATIRAGFAAVVFLIVLIVMSQPIASSIVIAIAMFGIYIPLGFYMDKWLYDRRQRREAQEAQRREAQPKQG